MKCSVCGCDNSEYASFCKKCGTALQNNSVKEHSEAALEHDNSVSERKQKKKSKGWVVLSASAILILVLAIVIAGRNYRRYINDERDDAGSASNYYFYTVSGNDNYVNVQSTDYDDTNDGIDVVSGYYTGGENDNDADEENDAYLDGELTSTTEDWAEAYSEELRATMHGTDVSDYRFTLCYVGSGDIPFLLLFPGENHGDSVGIYGWNGASVDYYGNCGDYGEVNYSKGNALLWSSTGRKGYSFNDFYQICSFELILVDSFITSENESERNGETISKEEHERGMDEYRYNYDWYLASWSFAYDITKESIADMIQNPDTYVNSLLISGDA